ncbi:GDYXXLXY domain-containing protein [Pantanalinema sp. GBBB05]|uniref:GDYXXLXY domain-containing protein n=1 Tax=Pantanalinema sp. GBBB05 TaxID=2604139 RepID=UPI001DBC10C7|nr:GDYXXLXY domain-containing protein [Pantanalinema sp. GBBB05]
MTSQPPNQPIDPPVELPIPQPTPGVEFPRQIPVWRFWLPLVFQAALIIMVPAQDAYTSIAGKPITLQTAPVDPYDLLRGYSQTLRYDISDLNALKKLPGGKWLDQHGSGDFYVVLEAPVQSNSQLPKPWKPMRISGDRPTQLATNQVAIRGNYSGWQVTYGLETYYMPEDQRQRINTEISQVQRQPQSFVVEAKVDSSGHAVPISLWVRDRNYRF